MNVTLVCNEYPPRPQGGIGTFIYYYARALTLLGHQVTIAGIWEHNTESEDDGVRVVTRASSMGTSYLDDRRQFCDWLELDATANRTDIIEVPEFDGMLPFRFGACPVVVRLHQSYSGIALNRYRLPPPVVYWCERRTLQCHPHWIAVSQFILKYTKRVFLLRPLHADVIYSFVPPTRDHLQPDDATDLRATLGDFVLYVGKLTDAKGAFDLARAARIFLFRHPGLSLVYVGKDLSQHGVMASDRIRALLGPVLSPRVHFIGLRPHREIAAWMAGARVYVQPSHLEAFSITILEAIQAGVPVVYTRRASGPEVVENNRTGALVSPNRPQEIASAVQRLLDRPQWAAELAVSAKNALEERFSLDACIEQSLKCYAKVIALAGNSKGQQV